MRTVAPRPRIHRPPPLVLRRRCCLESDRASSDATRRSLHGTSAETSCPMNSNSTRTFESEDVGSSATCARLSNCPDTTRTFWPGLYLIQRPPLSLIDVTRRASSSTISSAILDATPSNRTHPSTPGSSPIAGHCPRSMSHRTNRYPGNRGISRLPVRRWTAWILGKKCS